MTRMVGTIPKPRSDEDRALDEVFDKKSPERVNAECHDRYGKKTAEDYAAQNGSTPYQSEPPKTSGLGQDLEKRMKESVGAPPAKNESPAGKQSSKVPATESKLSGSKDFVPADRYYMSRLQEPFREDEIEWRIGSTTRDKKMGLALPYVTNRAIQNRLDEIFGSFGWRNEFKEWKGDSQLCGISIQNPLTGEWITKWDGADNSNMEAVKGGLSDAMKRSAYQWGIGRYLYDLSQVWCEIVDGKKFKEAPRLPANALPKAGGK